MGVKMCVLCGEAKETNEFYKRIDSPDGLRNQCKKCRINEAHVYYKANEKRQKINHREWYKAKGRHKVLKREYGLSKKQYDDMFEAQKGLCAICFSLSNIDLSVDHDHKTGVIRKLLCSDCNSGLGRFKDNPKFLHSAITYLLKHNAPTFQLSKEDVYATKGETPNSDK